MKTCNGILGLGVFLLLTLSLPGQSEPAPSNSNGYEELPELKASEILRADFLQGPNHKVREDVSPSSGANRFIIDSDFGVFEAEGNEMLIRRVNEINAIAKLKQVSRTDQFKDALVKAAKSPLAAAKSIVTDPIGTIANVPKGLGKFMKRAGETVKGIGKKKESSSAEGSTAQQMIGFSDAKRKIAINLGVDPYSSNAVLQKELDGISWASFAGGLVFKVGTMPIGGGIGATLTVTGVTSSFQDVLREKNPTDLKLMNRKLLLEMGASSADAEAFLGNEAFSPSAQTAFVFNLRALDGVSNRGAFVHLAAKTSSSEADAIFCVQTAKLMGTLHKGEKPLARVALLNEFPICIAKDGSAVVALQWDYAAFTPMADKFAHDLQALGKDKDHCLVALSGTISPRLRQELEARNFRVEDRLAPGPLK